MIRIAFIINGKYRKCKKIAMHISSLPKTGTQITVMVTQKKGHALTLASQAVASGHTHLIAVGGDGTLNEVANGMMQACKNMDESAFSRYRIGLLPLGTGNDFARNFNPFSNTEELLEMIFQDRYKKVDIGHIRLACGKERYFMNIADSGIGGKVAEKMEAMPRWMGSFLTYQYAVLRTLFTYKKPDVIIRGNGFTYTGPILAVIMANGVYFGGGLGIAPRALLDDGMMEVVILGKVSIWDYFKNLHKVRKCISLSHPQAFYNQSSHIKIETLQQDVPVDIDGEFGGYLPLQAEIIPKKIKLLG